MPPDTTPSPLPLSPVANDDEARSTLVDEASGSTLVDSAGAAGTWEEIASTLVDATPCICQDGGPKSTLVDSGPVDDNEGPWVGAATGARAG